MGDKAIEIFLRIRPSKAKESFVNLDDSDPEHCLSFHVPKAEDLIVNNSRTDYRFQFNGILDKAAKQDEVFDKVGKNAVNNALNGFNSTIFAYGQTGSGKTFTITGGSERYVDRGIIPRALSMLFAEFKKQSDTHFSVFISYLEIYNEAVYDLLEPEDSGEQLQVRWDGTAFHVPTARRVACDSLEDALQVIAVGARNRRVGSHELNKDSSRSHALCSLYVESKRAGVAGVTQGKVSFVDLAGSERLKGGKWAGSMQA
jgi:kinesin family protein 6/9